LLGIPLALGIDHLGLSTAATLFLLALAVCAATWIAHRAEVLLAERDSQRIVIDEIVGMAIALAFHRPSGIAVAAGFLLFRAFDVLKIWPANALERRLPGGAGVVMDDVASGVYANLALRLLV
jgi:phosphatidylglycerophosphatase A